ncbi:MAG TPA: MBL fold metallo-hydrolase [Thermoanaerobaculia bacterium]|nr:MBL fold metallo-hydrolase [Thermoanaerobaculia bacterium]
MTEPLADPLAMTAPAAGVKIRMYRQGLGDCFLLAFATGAGRPCYMLIDCGVLLGTPDAGGKMRQVAESLRDSTGGRIDVLVATHQHWDHLSGFDQAREVFDEIDFGEVWAGWTEDPGNALANRLRARRRAHLRALSAAARSLRAVGAAPKAETLEAVLGFFGDLGVDGRPSRIEAALDYVLGRGKPPRYRTPGETVGLPGSPARVHVLGPPLDEALLMRSDPSHKASEVYEKRLALDEETAFFTAVLAAAGPLSPEERELRDLSFPFDGVYRVDPEPAKGDDFFQKHYYGEAGTPAEMEMAWRQIEGDWLTSADNLALQLDSDTNNTSLALGIELSPGGKVLLFPGDAQVGNWLSWHHLDTIDAADLLRRTALYKVGHHASHNATLREKGLELMERPDLVAMIPVDEQMAHRPKGGNPDGWDMPFLPLLERLREKTRGRVLRADSGLPPPEELAGLSAAEREAFSESCVVTPLYLEITILP